MFRYISHPLHSRTQKGYKITKYIGAKYRHFLRWNFNIFVFYQYLHIIQGVLKKYHFYLFLHRISMFLSKILMILRLYKQNVCIFSCSWSGEDHHFLNIVNWSSRSGDIQILVMAYKVVLQKSDIFTQNCNVFVCNFNDFAFI